MKEALIESIGIYLLKKGFIVKTLQSTSFDILARDEGKALLIKVLTDANSVTRECVDQMASISNYITASPLIVSEKAGMMLQDNIVYSRFGIFVVNFSTFKNCIENSLPFVKQDKAGLVACLKGSRLREKREEKGLSLLDVSHKLGVTKKMVAKYENQDSEITLNNASKMLKIFGNQVFDNIHIFRCPEEVSQEKQSVFSKKYGLMGFHARDTKKVPFDIIARKDREIVLTEIGDKKNSELSPVSTLLDAHNLVIFKKKKPKGIPSMTKDEFLEFEEAAELIRFLKEFED